VPEIRRKKFYLSLTVWYHERADVEGFIIHHFSDISEKSSNGSADEKLFKICMTHRR
jgi:hypothetical protein